MNLEDIFEYTKLHELKSVYRKNPVKDRKESSAEHSWSCMMLAEFLLPRTEKEEEIDKQKVFELLLCHDIIEIEAGDTVILPDSDEKEEKKKQEKEERALERLREELPEPLGEKLEENFKEYEERKTMEAKFAKAVDTLDPVIEGLKYTDHHEWKDYSKEFLLEKKGKNLEEFPELKDVLHEAVDYLEKEGALK